VTNRSRHRAPIAIAALLTSVAALVVSGCASDPAPAPAPSASTTASNDGFDRDAYCAAMCERSATCGLDEATKLAGKVDASALERARDDRKTVENECATSCARSPVPPYRVAQAKSALACTKRDGCEAFATCLEEVASQ
jgi:hypothetical protein